MINNNINNNNNQPLPGDHHHPRVCYSILDDNIPVKVMSNGVGLETETWRFSIGEQMGLGFNL
jgi:hypothetical protein